MDLRRSIGENGYQLPVIGLGTFQPEPAPAEVVTAAVVAALKAGYRHIDTAFMYGDGVVERAVGKALKEWGGPREEVCIVTKLANAHHAPEDVSAALELSLENLGLEYVDIYLMHYPVAYFKTGDTPSSWKTARSEDGKALINMELTQDYIATWTAMEALVTQGKVKEIGISNFSVLKLKKLLGAAKIRPAVHQLELHPYLPQPEMLEFCESERIHLIAHSPLGGRPVPLVALNSHLPGPLDDPVVGQIAQKLGTTPACVLLKWAIQRGTSPVPKSYNAEHIASNLSTLTFPELSAEDMQAISNLRQGKDPIRFIEPVKYWGFDIFDESREQPSPED